MRARRTQHPLDAWGCFLLVAGELPAPGLQREACPSTHHVTCQGNRRPPGPHTQHPDEKRTRRRPGPVTQVQQRQSPLLAQAGRAKPASVRASTPAGEQVCGTSGPSPVAGPSLTPQGRCPADTTIAHHGPAHWVTRSAHTSSVPVPHVAAGMGISTALVPPGRKSGKLCFPGLCQPDSC